MPKTKIITCSCFNEYQEKTYGNGKRVANACVGVDKEPAWRCTVCEKEKKWGVDDCLTGGNGTSAWKATRKTQAAARTTKATAATRRADEN